MVIDRRGLARLEPDSLRDRDGHDGLLGLGDPDVVFLLVAVVLVLHWYRSDQGDEAGNGEDAVGVHLGKIEFELR